MDSSGKKARLGPWASREPDLLALLFLALIAGWLFREHLLGHGTFIGDSDRLNAFLNIRKFDVETIRSGQSRAWNEFMFMGFSTYGLHYMLIGADPIAYIQSLFPIEHLFHLAGYASCFLLALAGWLSYAFLKETCGVPFAAFVGAALYLLSTYSIIRVGQLDSSVFVLLHVPVVLLILRRLGHRNLRWHFVGVTLLMTSLLTLAFLQEVAYVVLLFGTYAIYRAVWVQTWRPLLVFMASVGVAAILAMPRLITVRQDFQLAERTTVGRPIHEFDDLYEFQNVRPWEFLRWLDDGIFGKSMAESAALGNTINLHEGLLLYTSAFAAFLILLGIIRFRGGWFRLARFQDEDASFFLWFVVLVFGVVLVKPVQHGLYLLFLKVDFTHARIVVAGLLPMCTLVAILLADRLGPGIWPAGHVFRVLLMGLSGLAALGILLCVHGLAERAKDPARVSLDEPLLHLAGTTGELALFGAASQEPAAPHGIKATVLGPSSIALRWANDPAATGYRIEMRQGPSGLFDLVVGTGPNVAGYAINDLAPHQTYFFRIQACYHGGCGPFSNEIPATTFRREDAHQRKVFRQSDAQPTWLRTRSLVEILLLAIAFALLITSIWLAKTRPIVHLVLVQSLGLVMLFQALDHADTLINSVQSRESAIPFALYSFLTAKVQEFRPPTRPSLEALRTRVQTDQFRSALICDPGQFPVQCAPHLSQFWHLRVVEGYGAGLPHRLAQLPWPSDLRSLRALSFPSGESLPWPLLSLLNVKYAIVVNPAFYKNAVWVTSTERREVVPEDIEVRENPFPVTPRYFFAESVEPVTSLEDAVRALLSSPRTGVPRYDVTKKSIVEGIALNRRLAPDGRIQGRFRGAQIEFDVEPADAPRFLVLNELYHPAWRAYAAGGELRVYPANVVMRGVLVPPGTIKIEFRFRPFLLTLPALLLVATGVALLALGSKACRRFEREG